MTNVLKNWQGSCHDPKIMPNLLLHEETRGQIVETWEFKVTCYITKQSCTDRGNPTKKLNFEWPVTLRKLKTF